MGNFRRERAGKEDKAADRGMWQQELMVNKNWVSWSYTAKPGVRPNPRETVMEGGKAKAILNRTERSLKLHLNVFCLIWRAALGVITQDPSSALRGLIRN